MRPFVVATLFSGEIPRSAIYIFDVASSTPLMLLVRNLPLTCASRAAHSPSYSSFLLLSHDARRLLCAYQSNVTAPHVWKGPPCRRSLHAISSFETRWREPSQYRDIEILVSPDAAADKRESIESECIYTLIVYCFYQRKLYIFISVSVSLGPLWLTCSNCIKFLCAICEKIFFRTISHADSSGKQFSSFVERII